MSVISDAANQLEAALGTVEGIRVVRLSDSQFNPPFATLSPPSLEFAAYGSTPSALTFIVTIAVSMDQYALTKLWDFIDPVVVAIEGVENAVVTDAVPGVFPAGNTDLPSYTLTVELAL